MNCPVRFGHCFLRAPLTYQFWGITPCCKGKLGELTKSQLTIRSCTFHFVPQYLRLYVQEHGALNFRFMGTAERMCKFCFAKSRCLVTFQLLFSRGCHADLVLVELFGADPLFPCPHATCDSSVSCADRGMIWIWEELWINVVRAISSPT